MTDHIRYAVDGAVATIRLARPEKKNALTLAMYAGATAALKAAADDGAVRAVLILGEPGAFSAGNDIEDFVGFAMRGALGTEIIDFLHALATAPKPLVAGVDGVAVGVGTTMLMHCDLVVASDRSVFATPFVDLGLVPEAASSLIAPRLMGHPWAFELLALGRRFDANRALAARLVNQVVAPDTLESTARALATEVAGKAPGALAAARRLLKGDPAEILARIDAEAALFRERLASPEAAEAFTRFLSKKKG